MTITIRIGDCRELLRAMPDESVNCIVTSPPYWGLRDYGVAGQIGMEPTLGQHLEVMVEVFREARRVLRKDGTCWVNYGDCYATSPNGRSAADTKATGNDDRTFRDKPFSTIGPIGGTRITAGQDRDDVDVGGWGKNDQGLRWRGGGVLKPKDLCMIPNRLAIALQDDGWWVRSEIIWHKPNPMPESIRDRPATSHEKMWLLSKTERYWYDALAVRTAAKDPEAEHKMPDGWDTGPGAHGSFHRQGREKGATAKERGLTPRHEGHVNHTTLDDYPRGTANLKNVWSIATAPFSEAHFATFPPALVEPCIKAGCPEGGIVLDPFGGAGTVGLVADRLKRNSIMFELNPAYAEIAERRLRKDAGMFTDLVIERPPQPKTRCRKRPGEQA